MENPKKIEQKVEKTLQVLEEMQRAEPKPFFYTRLEARMQKRDALLPKWTLRPVFIWSGLILIIVFNIGIAISYSKKADYAKAEQNASSFADEYGLSIDGFDSN